MNIKIADLRAAGLSAEEILRVVEIADNEQREKEREQSKIRSRNYRARQGAVTQITRDERDERDAGSLLPSSSSTSLEKEERSEIVALAREFAEFWSAYPHKVGKRAAEKSFRAARKRASFDVIMAGLFRYRDKTDDRPWCNPATWLNQDRWEDQPGPEQITNGKARPIPQKVSVLDFAAGFDARTRMQLAEREEIERQRQRP